MTPHIQPKDIHALIASSRLRIQPYLIQTPLHYDPELNLHFKCEQLQKTGSFKFRGALSKLSLLTPGTSVVTASTGNHGLGTSLAASLLNFNVKIFLPQYASSQKLDKLRKSGAELVMVDGDSLQAELMAKEFANIHQLPWISPYNDMDVIAGQGTIGMELTEQLPEVDEVFITVGGGGLISGVASWLKTINPNIKITGCQPAHSPEMFLSVGAGHVVDAPDALPTLSDGSAGPLEHDSITFPLCRQLIDRFVLVEENEIESAIRLLYHRHSWLVEGAAGVAFAAAIREKESPSSGQRVVLLCGGNIDEKLHRDLCGY